MRLRLLLAILVLCIIAAVFAWRIDKGQEDIAITSWKSDPSVRYWKSPYPVQSASNKQFSADSEKIDPEIKNLVAKADEILSNINRVNAEMQFGYRFPSKFKLSRGFYLDWPRINLSGTDILLDFEFCVTDSSFAGCINLAASKESRKSQRSVKPEWSREQAIKVATNYLQIFADTRHILLLPPEAKFLGSPDNLVGEWEIVWQRVDGQGHAFSAGRAIINVSETVGLLAANVELSDPYTPDSKPILSQETALAIAKKSHPHVGTEPEDISDYTTKSAAQWIVQPGGMRSVPARLAWCFELEPVRAKPVNYMDAQIIEIDAHTGEILLVDGFL